jgi:hypothetical protein
MKEKVKNLLKNPWIVGTGTGLIVIIITSLAGKIQSDLQKISFITVLKKWGNGLVTFFTLGIPVWIVLFCIIMLVLIIKIYNSRKKTPLNWIKKSLNSNKKNNYLFLLWFPLNQVISLDWRSIDYDKAQKIGRSAIFRNLTDNKVLQFHSFSDENTIRMDKRVYDYLDENKKVIIQGEDVINVLQNKYKFEDFARLCIFDNNFLNSLQQDINYHKEKLSKNKFDEWLNSENENDHLVL